MQCRCLFHGPSMCVCVSVCQRPPVIDQSLTALKGNRHRSLLFFFFFALLLLLPPPASLRDAIRKQLKTIQFKVVVATQHSTARLLRLDQLSVGRQMDGLMVCGTTRNSFLLLLFSPLLSSPLLSSLPFDGGIA